ncbi:hypothetical protein FHX08_004089 [Rhizobium sp. BK529]|uniref:hypothetical protein n=1 Tax=unclassified Rhizobium TaxID=2613769 RepID=UPI0014045B87|nr:hypothetical protein [Rhizobium sp. BK529]MBB3593686.1 hypothetical protein [Rhizobium sp. BK529]
MQHPKSAGRRSHVGRPIGIPKQWPLAGRCIVGEGSVMWRLVITAPFGEDIELAVIDDEGTHALVFPCQRLPGGWANAVTGEMLDIHPTHWRTWQNQRCDPSNLH